MDSKTNKQSGHRERLKTRFLTGADNAHSDEALLELLLTYALPQKDVLPLARDLLATFGSLDGVLSADLSSLTQQDGVKEHTAILLKVIDQIRLHGSHNHLPVLVHSLAPAPPVQEQTGATLAVQSERPSYDTEAASPALVAPPLFSDFAASASKPPKKSSPTRGTASEASPSASSGLFSNALLDETMAMLPHLPDTDSPDVVRAFLKRHLPFSGESTRERGAQYITRRMFPTGVVDRGLLLFARTYADRQELRDVCFYRFCKAEPLMYDLIEQLILPAMGAAQIERSLLRAYLDQRFPGYASTDKCTRAAKEALVSCGLASADREMLYFSYREPSIAAFAFVLHSEFAQPGMFPIAKVEQNRALRALLWQPASFLSMLYELRNRQMISKISEIDALRQFTTILTLDQVCERLATNGEKL